MIQTNFMEEIDCGNFFDHIDDLLEFPNDDVENGLVEKSSSATGGGIIGYDAFPPLWTGNSIDPVGLPGSEPAFSNGNSASDLSAELSVPYEDIVQLEWLSTFVEDSFSGGGLTVDKYNSSCFPQDSSTHQTNQFQTSSPISVLESSSASSNNNIGGKTIPVTHEKRARSKRPRPATFTPRPSIQLMAPHSESESVVESRPLLKKVPTKSVPVLGGGELQKKKKKIKILPPSGGPSTKIASQYQNQNQNQLQNENVNADTPAHPVRKCLHCEITKTPQWRAGPLGPKTLCNACGVRYKSGRLYPEYRPAASPTFVPSLHSNSHKKVLEMRTKTTEEEASIMNPKTEAQISPESELLPAAAI